VKIASQVLELNKGGALVRYKIYARVEGELNDDEDPSSLGQDSTEDNELSEAAGSHEGPDPHICGSCGTRIKDRDLE
jgi:hypothetical protein